MKKLTLICASLLMFVGCVVETEDFVSYGEGETMCVSFEPVTRIQLDENQLPVWNKGDRLSVYKNRDVNERWLFTGETGATSGVIARNEIVSGGNAIDEVIIAYPYRQDYVLNTDEKAISTTFAPTQTYLKNSYGLNDNVMISSGTGDDVILRNVFGWFKFQFVGSEPVRQIMIYDNEYKQLHGPIDINYETLGVTFGKYQTDSGDDFGGTLVDNLTVTLDCGENGVALSQSRATSFYIAMVPRIFVKGFTIEVTGINGTVMTKKVNKEIVIDRNNIKPFDVLQFGDIVEAGQTDLSSDGTANSYIVSEAGDYKFLTVQGNSGISVGAVASVEVLWETFGTDVTPSVGDLVSNVKYENDYITFTASDKKGNAVIAAKDAAGTILWSWHIWLTDKPQDQVYKNNAGTMMDRNLGATSATPGDVKALGLLYQWGRKDPFLGSSSISSDIQAQSTLSSWPIVEATVNGIGTVDYAITHPTTLLTGHDWAPYDDDMLVATLWLSTKTKYDPCPVGYRVPDGHTGGVWDTAMGYRIGLNPVFDGINKGYNLGKGESQYYFTEEPLCWYPLAGCWYADPYFPSLSFNGKMGQYWSCDGEDVMGYFLYIREDAFYVADSGVSRSLGYSVRCFKEHSTDNLIPTAAKNLSPSETANCYVVSEIGTYKFSTVKGNSSTSVGNIASAEVLWESFGTDMTPTVGSLVSNVRYSDGYIFFKATNAKGNAVIAAKDASGTILWSWHIWLTDKPEDQVYNNNAGTMMDRNLGATSATPGDVKALGLLYQWGRKDPFLGGSSISYSSSLNQTRAKSTLSSWPTTASSASNGTIAYATYYPTTFITYNSNNYDWYYTGDSSTDNSRWQSSKTIYDPCPAGYRVPDGGSNGVWSTAFGQSNYFEEDAYDSTNKGFNFGKSDTVKYLTEESTCWYPAAGSLFYSGGSLNYVGNSGFCWSCSPYGSDAYFLYFNYYGGVNPSSDYSSSRANGNSVRCLRE